MLRGDGDSAFWSRIATPYTIALGLIIALIFAVSLAAMRRSRSAVVVLWSLLPWLAVWWAGIAVHDTDSAPAVLLGAVLVPLWLPR